MSTGRIRPGTARAGPSPGPALAAARLTPTKGFVVLPSLGGSAVAALLDASAERDLQLQLHLAAWRDGYAAGIEDGGAAGWAESEADLAASWRAITDELWPDDPDAIDALQEFFGYVLSGRLDLHKILLLVGPIRSGKGAIVAGSQGQAGGRAVSLDDITQDRAMCVAPPRSTMKRHSEKDAVPPRPNQKGGPDEDTSPSRWHLDPWAPSPCRRDRDSCARRL